MYQAGSMRECQQLSGGGQGKTPRELAQEPQHGSVRHVELLAASMGDDKATLRYQAADDLAVCCDNGAALADRVAVRLGLKPSSVFSLRALPSAGGTALPLPTPCTVEQTLRYHADLRTPVSKELLGLLAASCTDAAEAERLRALTRADAKQQYNDYILRDGRGVAELLSECPSCLPSWAALLELMPRLMPRFYTISSSPTRDASTVHLTVKVLREPMKGAAARVKEGVCSTQLEGLAPGTTACVFVRSSDFHLPADPSRPVVMVGPGTGIAPFRAFLQEIDGAKAKRAAPVRLYFGCRRADEDYLYKEELDSYLAAGTLSSLRVAFSRAQASKVSKVYVQHRVREDGAKLWGMLQRQGHVYICGGTSMGRDVVRALQEAIAVHGQMSDGAAAAYVKDMQAHGRLVQELWS